MKQLAGKTLLEHVLVAVNRWSLPCALSIRDRDSVVFARGLPLLPDEEGEGPIAGIAAALRHAQSQGFEAVLTMPCDTPFLPHDLPEKLIQTLTTRSCAAVARSGGRLHPSCALWRVQAAEAVPDYLTEGRSLIGFAEALNMQVAEWPAEPYDPFFNINNEEDLRQAERILKIR